MGWICDRRGISHGAEPKLRLTAGVKNIWQRRWRTVGRGVDAKGYLCDVTDETQVQKMVADIEKELGVIDILVNNAGIIRRIPMTEMSAEEFREVIDIDLNAPFLVSKRFCRG